MSTGFRYMLPMNIIYCDPSYAEQVQHIFNDTILSTTALYDYEPRTLQQVETWFKTKQEGNFPVIGLVDEYNTLLGFGSYGTFRNWPAYQYTVEHSLYIHKDYRGRGCGHILLSEIIKQATQQHYHCLIAGIDSVNEASKRLHTKFGFEFCGTIKQVGYKFDKWLDLEFYQLLLPAPIA